MTEPTNPKPYEVGYGKPPRSTQFKQGQSGNPRGRPKGRKSFAKKVAEALNSKIALTLNGEKRRLSVEDAAIMRLVNGLLTAAPDKQVPIFRFLQSLDVGESVQEECDYSRLSDEELDDLERILAKLQGENWESGGHDTTGEMP